MIIPPNWRSACTDYLEASRAMRPDRTEDYGEPYRGIPRERARVPWFAWVALGAGLALAGVIAGGAL